MLIFYEDYVDMFLSGSYTSTSTSFYNLGQSETNPSHFCV